MTDIEFHQMLATYRILGMKDCIFTIYDGSRKSCYTHWKRLEKERSIYYYHPRNVSPIARFSFAVLTKEGADRYSFSDDRAWPFGAAFDVHLATSCYAMSTLVDGNPNNLTVRVEPQEITRLYGVTVPPNVPWVIRPNLERMIVFRVYVGNEPAEVTRTLKTMRENAAIASLLDAGEFGLLVLVSHKKLFYPMREAVKPHMSDTRVFVAVGPTADTIMYWKNR